MSVFANYLQIHHVPGAGELTVFCGAHGRRRASASCGSTRRRPWSSWATPARCRSARALGAISVVTKHELVLAIIGGLFVLEAVSVIVQVASFKMTGRRVFRMAPLHHHFEKKGWAGADDRHPLLDHRLDPGDRRASRR